MDMGNIFDNSTVESRSDKNYHGIELSTVEPVLQIYCQALTGREILFKEGKTHLPYLRNTWWTQLIAGSADNDRITVFLPASFTGYTTYDENFAWYKSAATQQVCHIEFGSYDFCFEKEAQLFENLRYQIKGEEVEGTSDFGKYFSLFENRALAARAFVSMENARINYLVKHHYPGLKKSYTRMQEDALLALEITPGITLRNIFCILAEGIEFDAVSAIEIDSLYEPLRAASEIVVRLCHPSASVEDAAEAAIRIYRIARTLPENRVYIPGYSDEDRETTGYSGDLDEFSGNFKLDDIRLDIEQRNNPGRRTSVPLTAEELKKLADMKIGISDVSDADSLPSTGLSSADLPRGVNIYQFPQSKYSQIDRYHPDGINQPTVAEGDEKLFRYDEWDFRTRQYISEWCCVHEKVISEGNSYFFDSTLERRKSLLSEIKKQFEKLPAEMLYKAKNLEDGDEYDLDLVISELIDKKAGHTPTGKVYWKKQKIHRDVAVAFLLDMSGSTADLIKKNRPPMQYEESIKYDFMKFVMQQHRRIIDVEKETVVLLCSAIELLGDSYGIYGFSGHGHNNVQYLVIKDLNESFSEKIKRRVDQIAPIHGTRMGSAIRHTITKLDACGNSLKLLFLVSDGYPQDHMYGWDDDDKQYAINDTKMALIEATRRNIIPFCLTVDSSGTDYLRSMCQDIGYEVLDDIEALPERLPMLYKKLST
jgi:nitric oxide reductase activation protein